MGSRDKADEAARSNALRSGLAQIVWVVSGIWMTMPEPRYNAMTDYEKEQHRQVHEVSPPWTQSGGTDGQ